MTYTEYFKKLRSIKEKEIKTEHHVSNLENYIDSEIIPKGLQIKLTPHRPGVKYQTFIRKWNNFLLNVQCA